MSFQVNCGQSIFHNNVLMKPIPRRYLRPPPHMRGQQEHSLTGCILSTSVIRKSLQAPGHHQQLHTSDCPHPALYSTLTQDSHHTRPHVSFLVPHIRRLPCSTSPSHEDAPSRLKQPPLTHSYSPTTLFSIYNEYFCQTSVFVYHVFPSTRM